MDARDWWARASRDAKNAVVCGVVVVVGLLFAGVIGLSQINFSSPEPDPPPFVQGYHEAQYWLGEGDTRALALGTCNDASYGRFPAPEAFSQFQLGCRRAVCAWRASDWPSGGPTEGDDEPVDCT